MAHSKSHIDRVLRGKALPSPPWPFTLVFLGITSRAARLTREDHVERCKYARTLVDAMMEDNSVPQLARRTSQRDAAGPGDRSHDETIAALRLEVELESARHTETRLRYALRDAQFLMATLWRIISALRDLIAGHHALEARVSHTSGDPTELARLRDETQQALAHKRTAQEEADRVAARLRTLDALWDQARTEVHRLSMHPDAADLSLPADDTQVSLQLVLPQDLLAQPALDDIAAALIKAKDVNAHEERATRELKHAVTPTGSIDPADEFDVLVAATRLRDDAHRRLALQSLLRDWAFLDGTRTALLHLIRDSNPAIRLEALSGLVEGWGGDTDARDAVVRIFYGEGDAGVRAAAARGLAERWPNDRHVRETLLRILARDSDQRVRDAATSGLARAWPGDAEVRDVLVRLINEDEDVDVRLSAARGLAGGWSADADVRALLLRLTRDGSKRVRMSAVCELATEWSGDVDVADALVRLTFDEDDDVRESAENGLYEMWPWAAGVREAFFRLARNDDHRTRLAVAERLPNVGLHDPDVRDVMIRLTHDEDEAVRLTAGQKCVNCWTGHPQVREVVVRLTNDADQHVRAAAQEWLKVVPRAS